MPAHPSVAFRWIVLSMVCFLGVIAAGCGPSVGEVSGTVTYKNAPLKSGTVTLMTKGGAMQGAIKEDGTYVVANVPLGDAKVTVVCNDDARMLKQVQEASAKARGSKGGPVGGSSFVKPNFSLIPEIYNDLSNTPLQTNIKRGKNIYHIDLK